MRICAVAALFLPQPIEAAAADPAYERVVETALASPILPAAIVEHAKNACSTALCFARALSERLPDLVRLEPVPHPDADTIRWVDTRPSVIVENIGGTRTLRISHFGRKATTELREASAAGSLPVDLRGNAGGDFERMLEIAGLLIGSRRDAVEIDYGDRIERRSIEGPKHPAVRVTRVLIDHKTASAALLLAHLLEAHAGAALIGSPAATDPAFLKRRLTVDHDWRLILPVARLTIP